MYQGISRTLVKGMIVWNQKKLKSAEVEEV